MSASRKDALTKSITPFFVKVAIVSTEEMIGTQRGYRHRAAAIGIINNQEFPLQVRPSDLGWTNADYMVGSLKFHIDIDASALVPLVNRSNGK